MFYRNSKKTQNKNKIIFDILKKDVENYRESLDKFSDNVVQAILLKMCQENKYYLSGDIQNGKDEIAKLLNNIPKPNILSLPVFLDQKDKDGNRFEIVNLKYGYLFIHIINQQYIAQIHVCKPDEFNQYLDIRKTFKQTLPAIVRDTTIASNEVFDIVRIAKLFIK